MYTDIPTNADLLRLLNTREPGSISIYLPTSHIPAQNDASRAQFRELASQAIAQVRGNGDEAPPVLTREAIADLEEHFRDLSDDRGFWQHLSNSVAIFANSEGLRTFRLPNRLTGFVEVGDRFFVKPLLRAVTFPQTAFVLALAENSVRLIRVTADAPAVEVEVPGMPKNLDEVATAPEERGRNQLGRLRGDEGQTVQRRQFARAVDRALRGFLTGRTVPLVLAAATPMEATFRQVNAYAHLADASISGNAEAFSPAELDQRVRPILDEIYAKRVGDVRDRFDDLLSSGRTATDLSEISHAAVQGAIDILMFDIDRIVPGTVDDETGAITLTEDNDAHAIGVVDEIARRVLLGGGRVLAVREDELPETPSGVAAILRYAPGP